MMRSLKKPPFSVDDVYKQCISSVRDPSLKERLLCAACDVSKASVEFEKTAVECTLFTLEADQTGSCATREELISVYDRMVRGRGRNYYDALILLPAFGICPLCGERDVSTLDHHAAKSRFPLLAVSPLNLVPACWECNHRKLDAHPNSADEQTLNPYLHDLGGERWLYARVNRPLSVEFFPSAPPGWSARLAATVNNHFDKLGLGALYTSKAGRELAGIRGRLRSLYTDAGIEGVRAHLLDTAASWSGQFPNSWRAAAYEALAGTSWFCDAGFSDIDQQSSSE